MRKLFMMFFVAAAMMTSCSSDEELSSIVDDAKGKVTVTVEPFTFADDDTRATLLINSTKNTIDFLWKKKDSIGIFPVKPKNSQIRQNLTATDVENKTISFIPQGWTFISGVRYAAYYPYQNLTTNARYNQIPVNMTGQTQNGNDNYNHIIGCSYLYTGYSDPVDDKLELNFKPAISIIKLNLTMPVAATWKSVTLMGNQGWITRGSMNAISGSVTSSNTSSAISLSLKNINTTESNKQLTLYLAVFPQTITDLSFGSS